MLPVMPWPRFDDGNPFLKEKANSVTTRILLEAGVSSIDLTRTPQHTKHQYRDFTPNRTPEPS